MAYPAVRVEDLSTLFDVDDASYLVLRFLSANSLGSLALCSKRFAVYCERFSESRAFACVFHADSCAKLLPQMRAGFTTRPSFALLVTSVREGLHLRGTPAVAHCIREDLPRSCHVIGAEVSGIFAPSASVEENAEKLPEVPWALLACHLPATRVRSFCLSRAECEPQHLQKMGLLTGAWDAFLLFPDAVLLQDDEPLPTGDPDHGHDHEHDDADHDDARPSRLHTVVYALQRANPSATIAGSVGCGAIVHSSPSDPLVRLGASKRPHDGAAGLVGVAFGGGVCVDQLLLGMRATPLSPALRISDARPARPLPSTPDDPRQRWAVEELVAPPEVSAVQVFEQARRAMRGRSSSAAPVESPASSEGRLLLAGVLTSPTVSPTVSPSPSSAAADSAATASSSFLLRPALQQAACGAPHRRALVLHSDLRPATLRFFATSNLGADDMPPEIAASVGVAAAGALGFIAPGPSGRLCGEAVREHMVSARCPALLLYTLHQVVACPRVDLGGVVHEDHRAVEVRGRPWKAVEDPPAVEVRAGHGSADVYSLPCAVHVLRLAPLLPRVPQIRVHTGAAAAGTRSADPFETYMRSLREASALERAREQRNQHALALEARALRRRALKERASALFSSAPGQVMMGMLIAMAVYYERAASHK